MELLNLFLDQDMNRYLCYEVFYYIIYFVHWNYVTFYKGRLKLNWRNKEKGHWGKYAYVDNLLKTTSREKTESLNSLKIIGNKLTLREEVISGMREEVESVVRTN